MLTSRTVVSALVATTAYISLTMAAQNSAYAATFTASNTNELRAAIEQSNALVGRDIIEITPGIFELTSSLSITDSVGIIGAGANATTFANGSNFFFPALFIDNTGTDPIANIFGVTIRNFKGGAIFVDEGASLSLSDSLITENEFITGGVIQNRGFLQVFNSTISNNRGGARGGGFANSGTLELVNSTVSGNTSRIGAGIQNFSNGRLEVVNSTISGNTAEVAGGGILNIGNASIAYSTITDNVANGRNQDFDATAVGGGINNIQGGTVNIGNTILAGNTDNRENPSNPNYSPDCFSTTPATFTSFRGNLVGIANSNCNIRDAVFGDTGFDQVGTSDDPINPLLGSLANNGGLTLTHALLPGSRAIDRGNGITSATFFDCPSTDQRGATRPFDGDGDGNAVCDVGAFEFGATIPVVPPKPVPEPSSTLGILAFSAFSASSLLKRNRKQKSVITLPNDTQ
jgi:hypothetical protein